MRLAYLATLLILQFALVVDVVPLLGEALSVRAAIGAAPSSEDALARLAIVLVGMLGASFAFAAPLFALARHRQRGVLRFLGLPGWAASLAIAGALGYVACRAASMLAAETDWAWGDALLAVEHSVVLAAVAVMAGGVLAAELLRRSVAPPRLLRDLMPARPGRTEVVHPPELRTHAQ